MQNKLGLNKLTILIEILTNNVLLFVSITKLECHAIFRRKQDKAERVIPLRILGAASVAPMKSTTRTVAARKLAQLFFSIVDLIFCPPFVCLDFTQNLQKCNSITVRLLFCY